MNVDATSKKTFVIRTEIAKYENVFDLFKKLYNNCKMLYSDEHLNYCYCNELKRKCELCHLAEYVKGAEFHNLLLRYRDNEERLLNLAEQYWFYINKIKIDIEREMTNSKNPLEFFEKQLENEQCFEETIKKDISKFNEEYMK